MTARDLADVLCRDIVRGLYVSDGREFIVTRFKYPVGDSVNLYVIRDGETVRVSDLGTTHFSLRVGGVELTEVRRDFIHSVCIRHGVDFDGTTLTKKLRPDSISADVIIFCQAVTQIATLQYDVNKRNVSRLASEVETLVKAKIAPHRNVIEGWTNETYDAQKVHVVDYHFNTKVPPRNLFVVTSTMKAERAHGTIRYWESRLPAPAMAIVDPHLELPIGTMTRLHEAASVRKGVAGNEKAIVEFALAGTEGEA